jgi:hypothetical protein
MRAGIEHFHADDSALGIVVEHDAGRHFLALLDLFGREADIGRVCLGAVFDDWSH